MTINANSKIIQGCTYFVVIKTLECGFCPIFFTFETFVRLKTLSKDYQIQVLIMNKKQFSKILIFLNFKFATRFQSFI